MSAPVQVGGPWFEDFERGQVFDDAPGMTLTAGHAAVHQAVTGDRLRLALDAELCRAVTGDERLLAHPNLVCDLAIGQSTGADPARAREPLLPRPGARAAGVRRARRCAPAPRWWG